jgi:hypothetical protein
VCALLALPGVSKHFLSLLDWASRAAGWSAIPAPAGPYAFFINLAGLFGVLWNVSCLRHGSPALHRVDVYGRAGVVALICFHVLTSGLSPILFIFVMTEILGGVLKWGWLQKPA